MPPRGRLEPVDGRGRVLSSVRARPLERGRSVPHHRASRTGGGRVSRRALITGIGGQDGSLLAELLLDQGYDVFGVVRRSASSYPNLADAQRSHRDRSRRTSPTSSRSCARCARCGRTRCTTSRRSRSCRCRGSSPSSPRSWPPSERPLSSRRSARSTRRFASTRRRRPRSSASRWRRRRPSGRRSRR